MVFLILISVSIIYFTLQKLKQEAERKDPRNWIRVSILDEIDKLPPGLILQLENKGPRTVGRSHFRLVFSLQGSSLCRVDTDIGSFETGVKYQITLRCSEWNARISPSSYPLKVDYILQVFPEMGKPIEPLKGQFPLR